MNPLYRQLLRPLFFRLPPEWVHQRAMAALEVDAFTRPFRRWTSTPTPELEVELWGKKFPNPVGLAAGFDKNAEALPAWANLGFGYAEIGTVTPLPQPGNPAPRIFRIPEAKALINRLGFPNVGAEEVRLRLAKLRDRGAWPSIPIGINIGKMKDTPLEEAAADYLECFHRLHDFADFVVVNISSPNTPGLRQLQDKRFLESLFVPMLNERDSLGTRVPVLVKLAPDLIEAQLGEIIEVIGDLNLDGIVATNTTIDHSSVTLQETGGLSGKPLLKSSTEVLRFLHRESGGKIPLIGAGGVFTADDARAKLDAGASLVQLYTGFVYQGPLVAWEICQGLRAEPAA
ncbi:MAG: quinone-dependent dihydroorotate dehydrogenase [Verrucomicrobiota bacterium]